MNEERIKRLKLEIRYLERQLAKELGYKNAIQMRRSVKKLIIKTAAYKDGFKTIKEWKHSK